MKKFIAGIILFTYLTFHSCESKSSSPENKEWSKLKCGLYINTDGEIGFPSQPERVFTPRKMGSEECPNVFITKFGTSEDTTQLKDVIDTATFEVVGADFYKDKNHIYSYSAMCDGGYLYIFSDKTASFHFLGGQYVTFESKIYHSSWKELDADLKTFKVFNEAGNLAKDKKGYFYFSERMNEAELKKELGAALFERLKKL